MNRKNPAVQLLSDATDTAELIIKISGAGQLSVTPELRRVAE